MIHSWTSEKNVFFFFGSPFPEFFWQSLSGIQKDVPKGTTLRPSTCGDSLITTFDQWDLGAKLIFQSSGIPMSTSLHCFYSVWIRKMQLYIQMQHAEVEEFENNRVSICAGIFCFLYIFGCCATQSLKLIGTCRKKWVRCCQLPSTWVRLDALPGWSPPGLPEWYFNSDDSEPFWDWQSCFISRFSQGSSGGHTIGQSWIVQEYISPH